MDKKVTIRGKVYNLDDTADLVSIQNALVPDNWHGKKADAVRLFISLQNMLGLQLKRHLAANFNGLMKAAIEEGEDSGAAKIGAAFRFEIDFTVAQVAAITKLGLGYSVKHGTEGKPQTHDLTQGEFLADDMSVVFDTHSIEKEKEEAQEAERAAKEATAKEKKDAKAKDAGTVEQFPPGDAAPLPGDATPENTPGDAAAVDKPKRSRKK